MAHAQSGPGFRLSSMAATCLALLLLASGCSVLQLGGFRPVREYMQGELGSPWQFHRNGGSIEPGESYGARRRLVFYKDSSTAHPQVSRPIPDPGGYFVVEWGIKVADVPLRLSVLSEDGVTLAAVDCRRNTATMTVGAKSQVGWYADGGSRILLEFDGNKVRCREGGSYAGNGDFSAFGSFLPFQGRPASIRMETGEGTRTGDACVDQFLMYRPEVVCMGDSTTAGHSSDGVTTWDVENEYSYLLSKRLGGRFVLNVGKSSDRSSQMQGRFNTDVLEFHPKAVVIYSGPAATGVGESLEEQELHVQAMLDMAASRGIPVILCEMTPCNAWSYVQDELKNKYNEWVNERADGKQVQVARIHDVMAQEPGGHTISPELSDDAIHPNLDGHKAIAKVLAPLVRRALKMKES